MTVRQVSLRRTVRCVEVGRTPSFGSSNCLVFFPDVYRFPDSQIHFAFSVDDHFGLVLWGLVYDVYQNKSCEAILVNLYSLTYEVTFSTYESKNFMLCFLLKLIRMSLILRALGLPAWGGFFSNIHQVR